MANQIFKDPYLFDFLGTDMPRREVEIERKLTEHIQELFLELGQSCVCRQTRYIWKWAEMALY